MHYNLSPTCFKSHARNVKGAYCDELGGFKDLGGGGRGKVNLINKLGEETCESKARNEERAF
jgi:hypothetical protein